jgi:SecD/SecF fusion protein
MNIWKKAILTGLAVTALSLILVSVLRKKKEGIFDGSPPVYYSAHYYLQIITPDGKINKRTLDSAVEGVYGLLRANGFKGKVTTNDKQGLDVKINDIIQSDTSLIDLLFTGKSEIEIMEVYPITALLTGLEKLALVAAAKYLPDTSKTGPASIKKVDTTASGDSQNQLKEFEFENTANAYKKGYNPIGSLIQFTSQPFNGGINNHLRYPVQTGFVSTTDTARLGLILRDTAVVNALPYDHRFYYGTYQNKEEERSHALPLYTIRTRGYEKAIITNSDISNARADFGPNHISEVSLEFTEEGSRKWANLTKENIDKPLAIIFNGRLVSAPYVEGPIENGVASISGSFTVMEAKALASQLSSVSVKNAYAIIKKEISRQSMSNLFKILLRSLLIFVLAAGISFPIFKALKNS